MKIPLTNRIQGSPCSTFSGQVLRQELPPSELSHLSVPPSFSAAFGRPRQDEDVWKIRSVCSRPLAPQLMSAPSPLPGPVSQLLLPPLLPDQAGSGRPLDGRVFPHHTVLDPVGFQGSRIPSSRHYYTTGTFPGVDTRPAGRPSKCEPSRLLHTTQALPMEPCPGSPRSETRTTGTGDLSPLGLPVAALLAEESPLLGQTSSAQTSTLGFSGRRE